MALPSIIDLKEPISNNFTVKVSQDNNSKATSSVDAPVDVATAIDQLRTLVCGLGVGLLVVSLALTALRL